MLPEPASLLPCDPQTAPAAELPAARLVEVVKEYGAGERRVRAVDGVTLALPGGQFAAVMGRSGSGKSTLISLLAGIEPPTSGQVWVAGRELSRLPDDALTLLRRRSIGIVYQAFHLLPTLSVRENVALPALLGGEKERAALARADAVLEEVELLHRRDARPHTLSGGEMQRTAIARALAHRPALLLADEPTGNLDSRTADQVLSLMRELARRRGATVLLVTHSREAAAAADRVIELRDGRVVRDETAA